MKQQVLLAISLTVKLVHKIMSSRLIVSIEVAIHVSCGGGKLLSSHSMRIV
jgi:hypothetical protein